MTQVSSDPYTSPKKFVVVRDFGSGSESPSADEESDNELNLPEMPRRMSELPSEYWTVLKALKYMRHGDQNACIAGLSCIRDCDLTNIANLAAISDQDGLAMLVNMLEVNDLKCRAGAMEVMKIITKNHQVVSGVVHMGIVPTIVANLSETAQDILEYACIVIGNISYKRRAARGFRKCGGIPKLVTLLKVKKEVLVANTESLSAIEKAQLKVSKQAAFALWKLSKYTKNKLAMMRTGIIPIMSTILLSGNKSIATPLTGVLSECSTVLWFQLAIETEGLVGVLLKELKDEGGETQRLCATALMSAAGSNAIVRDMIHFHGGLRTILDLIRTTDKREKRLLAAALGALWKSAISLKNVKTLHKLGALPVLANFIDDVDLNVRIRTVGVLAEMAKMSQCRNALVELGCVPHLLPMLGCPCPELLANVAHLLGETAKCPQGIAQLQNSDGVRLLWSLINYPNREVRISGLWAVQPCVRHAEDAGELVRSLTGSLGILINLLNNKDDDILAAACAVVAEVAKDRENLAVMTEHGVVKLLAKQAHYQAAHEDDMGYLQKVIEQQNIALAHCIRESLGVRVAVDPHGVRRELCAAIANCCFWGTNNTQFGQLGVISLITPYLETRDQQLMMQACRALFSLSHDSLNCVSMHGVGVVELLLRCVASNDEETQSAAAGCLANIRRFLIRIDRRAVFHSKELNETGI